MSQVSMSFVSCPACTPSIWCKRMWRGLGKIAVVVGGGRSHEVEDVARASHRTVELDQQVVDLKQKALNSARKAPVTDAWRCRRKQRRTTTKRGGGFSGSGLIVGWCTTVLATGCRVALQLATYPVYVAEECEGGGVKSTQRGGH